jgi:hypothetical protein
VVAFEQAKAFPHFPPPLRKTDRYLSFFSFVLFL